MVYRITLALLLLSSFTLKLYAQKDSVRQHTLEEIKIEDQEVHDFGNLHKVDDMKVTAGKKSEVIQVDQLTVNKSTNNTRQIYAKVTGLNIFENDGSGLQLSIGGRGLDPNRTSNFNVRQNGYDISADALGYPESYYTPPADALERIEIIKGAASLQFGTQFGGLLNFKMKPAGGDKAFGLTSKQTVGSWGFLGSFNSIYGTSRKLSYYAYVHYKRGDGWRPNSKFNSLNIYADLHYQLNAKNKIGIQITHLNYLAQQPGGLDDIMFAKDARQSNRERNWFAVNWNLLNLDWTDQISANTKWQTQVTALSASRQAIGFRPNRASQPDYGGERDLLKGQFTNLTLESRLMHHYQFFGKRQTILTGVRLYKGNNASKQGDVNNGSDASFNFSDESRELKSDYTFNNWNAAIFAEHIIRLSDKWNVTPGLRWEFINTNADGIFHDKLYDQRDSLISHNIINEDKTASRNFIFAGLGSSYSFSDKIEGYGNISQNYRSVTFSDMQLVNATLEIDPNLKDEKGWSADLGLRGSLGEVIRFDVSGFYLYYGNKIGEYYVAKPNRQVIRKRENIGVAQIYGLESFIEVNVLSLMKNVSKDYKLALYSNFALTNAHITESPLPNVKGSRVEYVPAINWKAGLNAGYRDFKLTFQCSNLSDQFTDATNAEAGSVSGVNGILYAYALFDLSASWSWKWLSLEASVNNISDAKYATRRATGYPGPGIIPGEGRGFFFTLGVKL
jgi:Fe(3+) dicitrate transport protein